MIKQNLCSNPISRPKRQLKQREWFRENGFYQIPPTEYIEFKILYAHDSDLRFVNRFGQEIKPLFNPAARNPQKHHGHGEPFIRGYGARKCHILRALAFYGERKTFVDERTGKSYVGHCHHLNADLEDHRKDNLLCWLSRPEHRIADNRQRALKTVVPNGILVGFDYAILRELQDPRTMTDADFQASLAYLRFMRECDFDPRIFTAADFHHWFAMPFDDFKSFFSHYANKS